MQVVKTNHFNKGQKGEMLTMGWRGCELYFGVKTLFFLGGENKSVG